MDILGIKPRRPDCRSSIEAAPRTGGLSFETDNGQPPDDLVEQIKRAVGGEGQVSSYVATALADYQKRKGLDEVPAAWRSETPIADDVRRQVSAALDAVGPATSPTRREVEIAVMTLSLARTIGQMSAARGHADVVDVPFTLCAREREYAVVTSDPLTTSRGLTLRCR